MSSTKDIKFFLVNAFTSTAFGGNPAAVIFLDEPLPEDQYFKIAANLNQPMASFLLPATGRAYGEDAPFDPATTKTFALRWFTPTFEAPQCGHATLALAHVLFQDRSLVPPSVALIRFETMYCIFSARRISSSTSKPKIEIEIPYRQVEAVDDSEFRRMKSIVARAAKKENIAVTFIGAVKNDPAFGVYVMVELDEKEELRGVKFDTAVFVESDPYIVTILTKASANPDVTYETRMFSPKIGLPEDHVCGSANCLQAPYWAKKLGKESGEEMVVKQVSERGGDLWTEVDAVNKKVLLRGEATTFAEGVLRTAYSR